MRITAHLSYRRIRRYSVWRLKRLEARDFSRVRIKFLIHEDRKKAIKAGMNAHIAKPISVDIILENLEKMRSNVFDKNRKYFNEPAEKS